MRPVHLFLLCVLVSSSDILGIPARLPASSPHKAKQVTNLRTAPDNKVESEEVLSVEHASNPQSTSNAPKKYKERFTFQGFSKAYLHSLPVWKLAAKRPVNRSPVYDRVFASHPEIKKLDPHTSGLEANQLAEGFYALRSKGGKIPHARKLTASISKYLTDKKVDKTTKAIIVGYQKQRQRRDSFQRYKSKLHDESHPQYQALNTSYRARKKREYAARKERGNQTSGSREQQYLEHRSSTSFEGLMEEHGIPQGLPAIDLEEQSWKFSGPGTHTATATKEFERYLRSNGYTEGDTQKAVALRVERVASLNKQRENQKRKLKFEGDRQHADHMSNSNQLRYKALRNTGQVSLSQTSEHQIALHQDEILRDLHQGEWWDGLYDPPKQIK